MLSTSDLLSCLVTVVSVNGGAGQGDTGQGCAGQDSTGQGGAGGGAPVPSVQIILPNLQPPNELDVNSQHV